MGNITTKSFLEKKERRDGVRICVMRRFKPDYDFDLWMPKLAPTEKLLIDYVKNKCISWKLFSQRYRRQVLAENTKQIKLIVHLSRFSNVTLVCWEKLASQCHRSLILEACLALTKPDIIYYGSK